jgi:hypothetical protein
MDTGRELKIEFGKFIEDNYPAWVKKRRAAGHAVDRVHPNARSPPHLKAGKRVTFIVPRTVSGSTSGRAAERCSSVVRRGDTSTYYSILPTATPYSAQRDLLGAVPPTSCRTKHPDWWSEDNKDERSKNRFERQLLVLPARSASTRLPTKPIKYVRSTPPRRA